MAWAEKNVTGQIQIPYRLLRGRCARLSWKEEGGGEALRLLMVVGSKLVPKESRMAARRMVRGKGGKDTSGTRHSRR